MPSPPVFGLRSGPRECICPEYKGCCPFCPWEAPYCFGYCSDTEEKCIGECKPESISNDEICTDLEAKAQYGDCANQCHRHGKSDDCKQCIADKTSTYNCGGIYASCGIFDLGKCILAITSAFSECKNLGSTLDIIQCLAEKVATNSACTNCFCDAVCKFLPEEFCDLCSLNKEFGFTDVLSPIRIYADAALTFPIIITRIIYSDSIPNCPPFIGKIEILPNQCAASIQRGDCLIVS